MWRHQRPTDLMEIGAAPAQVPEEKNKDGYYVPKGTRPQLYLSTQQVCAAAWPLWQAACGLSDAFCGPHAPTARCCGVQSAWCDGLALHA